MAEYIESICRSCFHSYVCEQFNEHRDGNNRKCHFFNDHFVHVDNVVEVVRCKDCKFSELQGNGFMACMHNNGMVDPKSYDFCSYGERKEG